MKTVKKYNYLFLSIISLLLFLYKIVEIIQVDLSVPNRIFTESNSVFLVACLSVFFLLLWTKKVESDSYDKNHKLTQVYSMILMLLLIISFAYFIKELVNNGFLHGKILYNQIISIVFSVISFVILIYVHVKSRNRGKLVLF